MTAPRVFITTPSGSLEVTDGLVTPDRKFREAWRVEGETIVLDQPTVDAILATEQADADEEARADVIKAHAKVTEWEDRLRGRSASQITSAYDGSTAAQKDDLLLAMTLKWALEVR